MPSIDCCRPALAGLKQSTNADQPLTPLWNVLDQRLLSAWFLHGTEMEREKLRLDGLHAVVRGGGIIERGEKMRRKGNTRALND